MRGDHDRHRSGKHQSNCQKRDWAPVFTEISPGRIKSVPIKQWWEKNDKHDVRFQFDLRQSRKQRENKAANYENYRRRNLKPLGDINKDH